MGIDVAGLVDTRAGLISRRIFIEPEIYERSWSGYLPAVGYFFAMKAKSRGRAIS